MRSIVIGLEVHAQLSTKSKIFSGSSTQYGSSPNSHACPVDTGLPGVLPVLNIEAVRKSVILGLATGSIINKRNVFARKNYFYPDLPKGYQITQHHDPILIGGQIPIEIDGKEKIIRIHHSHLEEDAGKSIHEAGAATTSIDLNRAGQPLLEIVSMPDMFSIAEAIAYLKKLHHLVTYLGICDGNMQEGSFRCDANISLRANPEATFGTRVEIKNLNSFKFIEKALSYEVMRQNALLDKGEKVVQETRLFNESTGQTRSMRRKEDSHDYRYFPEPDLPTLIIDPDYVDRIRATMIELPKARVARYEKDYELSQVDANVLVSSRELADYFDRVIKHNQAIPVKLIANWIIGSLLSLVNKSSGAINNCPVSPETLSELLGFVHQDEISQSAGKTVLEYIWENDVSVSDAIDKLNLKQISDPAELAKIVDAIIENNPNQYAQYKDGKVKLFGFFVGQAMKQSQGRANPALLNDVLRKRLDS